MHGHGVRAEAEEEGLAEGEDSGVAPDEIDADGDDGDGEIFAEHVELVVGDDVGGIEDRDNEEKKNGYGDDGDEAEAKDAGIGEAREERLRSPEGGGGGAERRSGAGPTGGDTG